jgi:hypothetical protein
MEINYLYVLLVQTVAVLLYLGYVVFNFGIIHSISDSYYKLPQNRKPLFWLFTSITGIGMLLLSEVSVLFFISGTGLFFVGTAATFYDRNFTTWVHYVGAIVGLGAAALAVVILYGSYFPLYLTGIFTILSLLFDSKRAIWWIEVGAIIGLIGTLFYYLI